MSLTATESAGIPSRILVVRLGAMGDVVQTLPAAADLRQRYPEAEIAWALESRWEPLLAGNPHVDRIIPVRLADWRRSMRSSDSWRGIRSLVRELRSFRFQLALDFQGLAKSAAIALLSGTRRRRGFVASQVREQLATLAYTERIQACSDHVVDRYRELAAGGPVSKPLAEAAFPLPEGQPAEGLPDRFVLASPQAGWGMKQWPEKFYSAVAERIWIDHRIPLLADCPPGRTVEVEAIRDGAPDGAVIPHPSSIPELLAATRLATAVIGVDSGPLHVAAALGKPGVAIFGPTDPTRNGPHGSTIEVIRVPDAKTSYKRGVAPDPSMRACSPSLIYEKLSPLLG